MKNWNSLFVKTDIYKIELPVFDKIDHDWFLITAGEKTQYNTMTASWGTLGVLWNKPIAICFIRPVRHTFTFMEDADYFSLCFFDKEYRKILNYCGANSGRDVDKIKNTGLKPVTLENQAIGYEQANLILECKKIYYDDIKPVFMLPDDLEEKMYPNKDYHRMYIGEITTAYKKA